MSDCKVTTPVTLDELKAICRAQRIAGLREAAEIARNHVWLADVEWWLHATKTEVARRSAQECVDVILARIAELEKP